MLTPKHGEVITYRYRLEREIARGGMGSVWAGQDTKLRRKVAVKLVAPNQRVERDLRDRFEREAMAVAQLQSPHVVQIFDFGVDRDCPYIVMELLEGEDLRTRLHRLKRVSLEAAAHILVQTAKALSVAHAAGIVHRDLKPGNIYLVRAAEEEIIKVLDFGVATNTTDLYEAAERGDNPVLGTPQFMSPEQARALPDLDHRADLWSLGVIIYKAIAGRLPFRGGSPTEVIVNVCTTNPTPISKLAPDLPHTLDEFFTRALARDRKKRFSSAREMALAFSRISPVNFTTLSMPDPAQIDAAIRDAVGAAADDEEAKTVAVDEAATVMKMDDEALEEQKTSVVEPLPRLPPVAAKLPPPKPPPRRGGGGGSDAPPELPPLDFDDDESLSPDPAAPTMAIDKPLIEDIPEAATSAPVLLTRPKQEALTPTPSLAKTPLVPKSTPPSQAPPTALRPSNPTLGAGVLDSSQPGAPDRERTSPALFMALGAIVVGILVALVGSVVLNDGAVTPANPPATPAGSRSSRVAPPPPATAAATSAKTTPKAPAEPEVDVVEPTAPEEVARPPTPPTSATTTPQPSATTAPQPPPTHSATPAPVPTTSPSATATATPSAEPPDKPPDKPPDYDPFEERL